MECKKQENLDLCVCGSTACSRKGVCCECLRYHLKNGQLPSCCFPPEAQMSSDHSFKGFAKAWDLCQ